MSATKRILLVEDDDRDAELTLRALAAHHTRDQIAVVNDGAEALDYLYRRGDYVSRGSGNPVVVLLDLKLPKVSGLEVLREVKSDARLRAIPVVVLSSSREDRDLRESYARGANAYVVKPLAFAAFVDTLTFLSGFWTLVNQPPPECTSD